jgi:hypothetical protein
MFAAEQFMESLEEPYTAVNVPATDETSAVVQAYRSKIYLFIGRSYDWNDQSAISTTNDGVPEKYDGSSYSDVFAPEPVDSINEFNQIYDDMISLKRVTRSDVSPVVRKRIWTSNITYDMYKHNYGPTNLSSTGQSKLFDSQFYVMNKNFEVYKCLYNGQLPESPYQNGKPSTVEPTGTGDSGTNIISDKGDGYKWQYMYTLGISDYIKFVSTDFIPVKIDSTVTANAVNGSINQILIKNRGGGLPYGNGKTYYTPVIGNGTTKCIVAITVTSGGVLSSAEVAQVGQGYTFGTINLSRCYDSIADAIAEPTPSANNNLNVGGANLEVIISPPGGHGSNAFYELGAYRVMINKSLNFLDGLGDIPVDMEFRRFGLISDPKTNSNTDFYADSASACKTIKFTVDQNSPSFEIGEIIYQDSTKAKGRVIHYDPLNGVLKYYQNEFICDVQTEGTNSPNKDRLIAFSGSGAIQGLNSLTQLTPATTYNSTINGITFTNGYADSEIKRYSGSILYVENRKPIIRSNDQIEDIKLVIEF